MHLCFEWELQRLWRDCSNAHTRLSFCCSHMQSIDCVSKLSMTFKCTYVLNGGSKGSGETAQMRRLVWAFRLLAHAIKTPSIACLSLLNTLMFWNGSGETAKVRRLVWVFVARTCNKTHRRLRDLLMFWMREVKTLARHFCADSSKVGSPWRDCAFSQKLSERIHSYFGKKCYKQNAAVIPAIFLDLCEAWINYFIFSFNFQENVYFRFLKLHRGKLFMLSRKT